MGNFRDLKLFRFEGSVYVCCVFYVVGCGDVCDFGEFVIYYDVDDG